MARVETNSVGISSSMLVVVSHFVKGGHSTNFTVGDSDIRIRDVMRDPITSPVAGLLRPDDDGDMSAIMVFRIRGGEVIEVSFTVPKKDVTRFNTEVFSDINKLKEYVRKVDGLEWSRC